MFRPDYLSYAKLWLNQFRCGRNILSRDSLSIVFIAALTCVFISGCTADPEESARALYTQANDSLRTAKNEGSYQQILHRFQVAQQLSERIISTYPGTVTAAGVSSGDLAIGGYTLGRIDEVSPILLSLATAEVSLLDAAALAVYSGNSLQEGVVLDIAERLAARGNYQAAGGILENLLRGEDTPTTFGPSEIWGMSWSTDSAESVLRVASIYYDMGQQQYGAKLLSYAKGLRDNIDRDWWKPGDGQKEDSIAGAYHYFADAYIHFEMRDEAFQVTNAAFEHYSNSEPYFILLGDSFADVFIELGFPDQAAEALDLHVEAYRNSTYDFTPRIAKYARLGKVDLALSLAEEIDVVSTAFSRYLEIATLLREDGDNQLALQVSNRAGDLALNLDLSKLTNQKRIGELARFQASLGFGSSAIDMIEKIDDPVIYSRFFIELSGTEPDAKSRSSSASSAGSDLRSKELIENLISNETLYFGSRPSEIIDLHSALIANNQTNLALQVLDRLSADFAKERNQILASGKPLSQSEVDNADSLIATKYALTGKATEGVCRASAIIDDFYLTRTLLSIEEVLFESEEELSKEAKTCLSRAVSRIVPHTKFWAL